MKQAYKILFTLLALVITASSTTSADHLYDSRQKCEEITQYFDPALPFPGPNDTFSTIQQQCPAGHHNAFPGTHKEPVVLNQHKPAIKTSHQPWSEHKHAYFNDSKEGLNKTITVNGQQKTVNFYYQSAVDTFEIHLESDFMQNVMLDKLQCAGLPDGNNCVGTGNLGQNADGKLIGFDVSFDKQNGLIKWHFPGKAKNWVKPNIKGENPTLDKLLKSNVDTTKEKNRMLELGINFQTKDVQKDSWSATITSRVLIKDFVAKIPPNTPTVTADWQAITHASTKPGEFENYYWFPIGTTTTVWERAPIINICQELKATINTTPIKIEGKDAYAISVDKITFAPKNEIPEGAELLWTSDNPSDTFWQNTPLANGQDKKTFLGNGTAASPIGLTVYYTGQGNVQVKLKNIPENQANPNVCYAVLVPPVKECKQILVDHPETIYEGTYSIFKAKSLDTNNKDFGTKIKYSVDPGYGEFFTIAPNNVPKNPSKSIFEATPTNATVPFPDNTGLNPGVIIDETDPDDLGATVININNDIAIGNFNIEDYLDVNPGNINDWENSGLMAPEWWTDGLIPQPPKELDMTMDTTPYDNIDFGFDSIFDIEPVGTLIDPADIGKIEDLTQPPIDNLAFLNLSNESITVNPDTTVYFWAKKSGKGVIHVETIGTTVPACKKTFDIEPYPYCAALNLTSNPAGPLTVGQPTVININPIDIKSKVLGPDTKISLSTTAGGKFTTDTGLQKIIELKDSAVSSQFPIQFANSTQAGKVTIKIDPSDKAYSPVCKGEIEVKPPTEDVCKSIKPYVKLLGTSTVAPELARNLMYEITTEADFSSKAEDTITYTIDSKYGTFLKKNSISSGTSTAIKSLQLADKLTPATLKVIAELAGDELVSTITASESSKVFLITYSQTPGSAENILTIKANGTTAKDCTKTVPFEAPEEVVEVKECKSVAIQTLDGKEFDPTKEFTTFKLTGDYSNHQGELKVSVNTGTVSKISKENYSSEISYTTTELSVSNNGLAFEYHKAANFDPEKDSVEIKVKAIGAPAGICESTIKTTPKAQIGECIDLEIINPERPWDNLDKSKELFEIKVKTDPADYKDKLTYVWKVSNNNGNWVNNDQDKGDEVTTKGTFSYFLEDFEPGTLVEIWAKENGEKIKDSNGDQICYDYIKAKKKKEEEEKTPPEITKRVFPENKLKDLDEIINISSSTPYVTYMIILKTGDDISDLAISDPALSGQKISSENLTGSLKLKELKIEIRKDSLSKGTTIFSSKNDQEDDYKCEGPQLSNTICIYEDFKQIQTKFGNGQKINFKNVEALGEDGQIIIEYKMTNNTVINNEECKTLKGACGEQFINEAKFEAKSKTDEKEIYKDKSSTKVIAICPYVLTREGGDVFFHDVIETGIDVAQCSKVKGSTGPGVTPEPDKPKKVVKTGIGDLPETILLQLPSHDVCRYSNLEGNLKGYDNVLKNFSSTICELRADVAETWKEKNIVEAMNANITRIARWGQNLPTGSVSLSDTSQLGTLNNHESGVFVKTDENLTINGSSGPFIIKGGNGVPAAQTYIIKGHDLIINSNIEYDNTATNFFLPKSIPSAAFIVIDGDIIIDPSVTKIEGILMAVDLDGDEQDGKVTQTAETENRLVINGSLIGNVAELFANRIGVGDPTKDEGSVTIHYDERILLNTPPGISELIDIKQAIVPN